MHHIALIVILFSSTVAFRFFYPGTSIIFELSVLSVIAGVILKDLTSELYVFTSSSIVIFKNLLSRSPEKLKFAYEDVSKIRTKSTNILFEDIQLILKDENMVELKNLYNGDHVGELLLDIKNATLDQRKELLKIHRLKKTKSIKDYQLHS